MSQDDQVLLAMILFREELCTHSSHENLLVCLHTMWDGQTGHEASNPYMRDTAHVASTGLSK